MIDFENCMQPQFNFLSIISCTVAQNSPECFMHNAFYYNAGVHWFPYYLDLAAVLRIHVLSPYR